MIDVADWVNEPGKPVRIWEGDCLLEQHGSVFLDVTRVAHDEEIALRMGILRIGEVANRDTVMNLELISLATPSATKPGPPQGLLAGVVPPTVIPRSVIGTTRSKGSALARAEGMNPPSRDLELPAAVSANPKPLCVIHKPTATCGGTEVLTDLPAHTRGAEELSAASRTTQGRQLRSPVGAGTGTETIMPLGDGGALSVEVRPADLTEELCPRPLGPAYALPELSRTLVHTLSHGLIIPRRLPGVNHVVATERIERARQQLKLPMEV